MTITIYTDGACKGNGQQSPTPGGWGAILINPSNRQLHIAGHSPNTTNQRMELTAAIKALEALKMPLTVDLYTDSKYLQQGLTEWLASWRAKDWKTSQGKPVANADLWMRLDQLSSEHEIRVHWVNAHDGNQLNELADSLANIGATGQTVKRYRQP